MLWISARLSAAALLTTACHADPTPSDAGGASSGMDQASSGTVASTTQTGSSGTSTTSLAEATSSSTDEASDDVSLDLPAGQNCGGYDQVIDGAFLDDDAEVVAFAGVECVEHDLAIRLEVSDITPLTSLRAAGSLTLEAPALAALDGLEQLEEIHDVLSLGAYLPDEGCVGTQVFSLAPLISLERVGALFICNNAALTSVAELSDALTGEIPGRITVASSPSLESLVGLDGLTGVGLQLELIGLPLVQDLQPLASLSHVDGGFAIAGLDAIGSLEGLESLEYAGELFINENAELTTLAGLDNVAGVGQDLSIRNNPMLPQAEAEAWASRVDVGGVITICENLGGPPC